ncbi:MAG: ABC transporter substrate-binding protein [Candidatus Eisenbacteria bacterium]|nr:ABC transporter substrate-binding protein [Candidatus Eisenbacteria bacterium]
MRRKVTLRLIAAAFTVALAAALCACGGNSRPSAVPRARLELPPDTMCFDAPEIGRYGGRFVIAGTSDPRTFNALIANDQPSTDITRLLFVGLTEFDNLTQQTTPQLARRWERSPDGRTWTFHLRRGARFSDGHAITSDDVLFSFAVVYDDSLHPSAQDLLKVNGKKFELSAPDSYTVVFRIAAPMALFETLVGDVRIMPRHRLEADWKRGVFEAAYSVATPPQRLVTSGAWRLSRHVPGERTVLVPNPWWFGVDRAGQRLPYLDEVVFEVVPDQNTAALKFQAGDVDGLDNVKPEDYGLYQREAKTGGFTLYDIGPSLISNFVWFNLNRVRLPRPGRALGDPVVGRVRHAWFSDPLFRRAVSKAIDREAIIRSTLFGFGFKNWSTMTRGNREWFSPELTGDDYDVEGAKRLLAKIGMRDRDGDGTLEDATGHRVSFTLKTNGDAQVRVATDNLIRDDLARVGIEAIPVQVDIKTLITNIRSDFDYEAVTLGLGSAVPPDPAMAANFYRSSGTTHYWNVRQSAPETAAEREIDRRFEVLADTLDPGARHASWKRIEQIINQQCLLVWLPSQMIRLPVRDGFGNLHPVALPHRLLWNIDRVFVKPHAH